MRHVTPWVLGLLALGTLYRIWPVFAGQPWLSEFFMTEDGYLMLTVARNMAIGLGMTVSDGTIPTNGVQPLSTFLFALPYLASGGDKVTSLIGVHLILAGAALAAAFAIRSFAARVLAPRDPLPAWPWAVAGLWFVGPVLLRHSMNGLETGLYTLVIVITLLQFARVVDAGARSAPGARLWLGALCGLAVLARNDAVFLVASIFLVWAVSELIRTRGGVAAMVGRLVGPGVLSILVAAPWLINNQLRFGSIVPISGQSEILWSVFAENLPILPAKLFENAFPMLPVPGGIEAHPAVIVLCLAALAAVVAVFLWRVLARTGPAARAMVLAYLGHGVALAAYYGLWFGTPHFLSRYMAPLAPLLILAALIAALETGRLLLRSRPWLPALVYTLAGGVLSALLLGRALLPGMTQQGHAQVVAWVAGNVPDRAWAGAPQTGTLGYWHDRTLNLDGKVNPAALVERVNKGHVLDYVVGSPIDYVVDWAGVGDWVGFPEAGGGFADAFELVLKDEAANLSVMRRRVPRAP